MNGNGASRDYSRDRLLADSSGAPVTKSEFAKAASTVAKEINSTVLKLHKLARLAKKKSLFDDRPLEINELIHVIKQDISKVNRQIGLLSQHVQKEKASGGMGNRQVEEHASNVITSLQTRLASTSGEFKSVLEIRTQNMKDQKNRRDQYSYSPAAGINAGGQDVVLNMGDGGSGGFGGQQSLALMQQPANMEYLDSRYQAIESIESTIAELGQIYQQFAQILSAQREMVQRIDDNVVDIEGNVSNAHGELLKYFQNLSTNRWLMIKVFAVLVVFFLLFVIIT
ncbi:cis-Golgi t-SNARE syntaxin [Irineochytrium annulatum]|nr:cis-Golgi t-SNARE syntaxin [Irineochytrium annulatum]